jgi:hypothetical protein
LDKQEMTRKEVDVMPRAFAAALFFGVVIGGTFWAGLLALIVR